MNTDLLKAYRAERASNRGGFLGMVRAARNVGPAVCDAIRARLESLREECRANVRTIAGGAE